MTASLPRTAGIRLGTAPQMQMPVLLIQHTTSNSDAALLTGEGQGKSTHRIYLNKKHAILAWRNFPFKFNDLN
jgi:hypothetical protein